jgi:hypothetical protein
MRAWCDRGISRVVRGSGSTGAAASSLRTGGGDKIGSTRGFRAGGSADGAGSEGGWLKGLPFRREERLGRLARAPDPLAIITARGGACCRWLSTSCPELVGYSRHRDGIRQLWRDINAFAGCGVHVKSRETGFMEIRRSRVRLTEKTG